MRVLVDTSVWVDFFNGYDSPEATALAAWIESDADIATCGVVIAEFFQGLRRPTEVKRLEPYFRDMTLLLPREPDTWLAAAALYRNLRQRGVTVRSTIDCAVVCLAVEGDAVVLAKDRDVKAIIESGLSEARAAPPFGG